MTNRNRNKEDAKQQDAAAAALENSQTSDNAEVRELKDRIESMERLIAEMAEERSANARSEGVSEDVIGAMVQSMRNSLNPSAPLPPGANVTGEQIIIRRGDLIAYNTKEGGSGTYRGGWFKVEEDFEPTHEIPTVAVVLSDTVGYDSGVGVLAHDNMLKFRTYKRRYRDGTVKTVGPRDPIDKPSPRKLREKSLVVPEYMK